MHATSGPTSRRAASSAGCSPSGPAVRLPRPRGRRRPAHRRAGPPTHRAGRRGAVQRPRARGSRCATGARWPWCSPTARRSPRPAVCSPTSARPRSTATSSARSTCPPAWSPTSTASSTTRRRSRSTGRSRDRSPGAPRRPTRAGHRPPVRQHGRLHRRYAADLAQDRIPAHPFVLVGQMNKADPTRSPAGTETVWAYTHVPLRVRGDAGGTSRASGTPAESEAFADRVEAEIEASRARLPRPGHRPAPVSARPRWRRSTPTSSAARSAAAPPRCHPAARVPAGSRAWAGPRHRCAACTWRRRRPTPAAVSTAPAARTRPAPRIAADRIRRADRPRLPLIT